MDTQAYAALAQRLTEGAARALTGKKKETRLLLCALAAGGHVLLEDVPGTGKTALARALAQLMGLQFSRIQGTPDLLPSDVTGSACRTCRREPLCSARGRCSPNACWWTN